MNTVPKMRSLIKIILLVGLCLYTVLSSLLFIYLQTQFFDPIYFRRVMLPILIINTVFLLNLFLSAKQLLLPEQCTNDHIATLFCSVVGFGIFLFAALNSCKIHDLFFAACNFMLVALSLGDFPSRKR